MQPNELYSGVNMSIVSNLIAMVWLLFQQETKALLSNKQYPGRATTSGLLHLVESSIQSCLPSRESRGILPNLAIN